MKRTIMAALVALAIAGAASAQNANPPKGPTPDQAQQPQQTTVTGKLEWVDGTIGLKSGGAVYYAPQVRELVGFVKDLQEGATVTLTGSADKIPYSPNSFFRITKLSFNGKDYEFNQGMGFMGRGMGTKAAGKRMQMQAQGPCEGMDDDDATRGPRW